MQNHPCSAEEGDVLLTRNDVLLTRNEELTNEIKAQAEQIDKLHKQMAELRAGYHLQDVAPVLAKDGTDITQLVAVVRDGIDEQKQVAVRALESLLESYGNNTILIAKAGGIPPLVALIRDGTDRQKTDAVHLLRKLAYECGDNKVLIAQAGGIPPLVALVRDGTAEQKQSAAGALKSLANSRTYNIGADNEVLIGTNDVLIAQEFKRAAGI